MKSPWLTLTLIFLCLMFPCAGGTGTLAATKGAPEKEIFINIHSGIKTIPVRKVIGVIIKRAEGRGVDAITGSGKRRKDGAWLLELNFLDKAQEVKRYFKWRYVSDKWELTPLNRHAEQLSFPLDKYVFGPAINMGLGMVEEQGVSPKGINGRADKVQNGLWQFSMTGLSDSDERFIQKWSYDAEEGALYPSQFDHSDLDKLLVESIAGGEVDFAVVKKTRHLQRFLKKVAKTTREELERFSREEQLAFWINAYNATMLKVIADNYPNINVESVAKTIEKKKFKVAREKRTLVQIRDGILGNTFKDERAQFALISAPGDYRGLRAEAYCGRRLEGQLDEMAGNFLNNPE
ncbi:MAG: DUF547 domain-containing protein [Candidatus Brocadiales bacterium]